MSQLGNGRIGAFLLLFQIACATPGYRVFISTRVGEAKEATGLLDRLGSKARAAGYSVVWERRRSSAFADRLLYSYVKKLSGDKRDAITVNMSGYIGAESQDDSLDVVIQDLANSDVGAKTQIDLLADEIYRELATSVGGDKVKVTRGAAGAPMIY